MSSSRDTHVVQITIFTPNAGQLDEFVKRQVAGVPAFGDIPGWRGTKLYRALDGGNAVMVTHFDSVEDQKRFAATAAFAAHRETLLPLLESASGGPYELVYERAPSGAPQPA